MTERDYYGVLGVARGADTAAIRSAFRAQARKHHPDVNRGDPAAEQRFKAINEAHEVLTDPEKRRLYDRYGADWERARAAEQARETGGAAPWADAPRATFHGDGGEFGDLFEQLFRESRREAAAPRRGDDLEQETLLTLEEADRGATRVVRLERAEGCAACGGLGAVGGQPCAVCGGAGALRRAQRLEATIPAGALDGARVRLAGQGTPGRRGGPPGDLYLLIRLAPDPRFVRDGADLQTTVAVPLYTALLGGEVTVAGVRGDLALRIPPETQNGRIFRLAGQGLGPAGRRGDLRARVEVTLPRGLGERERALVAELAALEAARGAPAAA